CSALSILDLRTTCRTSLTPPTPFCCLSLPRPFLYFMLLPPLRSTLFPYTTLFRSLAPSDLSPLHSHREFARIHALLDIKGIWFEHSVAVPEIFLFETTQYRGFETTGLARGWQNAGLDFFDGAQDHRYFVGMEGDARSGVKL